MYSQNEKLSSIVPKDSKIEKLAGDFQFTEGPVWNASEGFLIFSDLRVKRIYKWVQDEGITVFREPINSNGLTYDKEGRVIVAGHGSRKLIRIEKDGTDTVLADQYSPHGHLNSPNDVVVKSDGVIYFTDPPWGIKPEEQELPFQGVFCLDPDSRKLTLVIDDFDRPNGLAFSPDENVIYIGDDFKNIIRIFSVDPDGLLSNGRVFAELEGPVDGMKVDVEGNLYVAAAGGLWVFSDKGERLGIIRTPETPANCAWGDDDWRSLFVTARTSLYRMRLTIPGVRGFPNR